MKQEVTSKKVFIRTLGCQMNVRDSEVVCGLLLKEGFQIIDNPDGADIVIFNTCSVRKHAEDKAWSEIGKFNVRNTHNANNANTTKPIIGLIGCMAQNYKGGIFEKAPAVDFVVGPSDIAKIPGIIERLLGSRPMPPEAAPRLQAVATHEPRLYDVRVWETDGTSRPEEIYHTGFYEDKEHAYVVISEGCSNYCSYCVVPYVRGEIRHRNYKDILEEIEEAIGKGINRLTLLGQNVNAYKSTNHQAAESPVGFVGLLGLVNEVKGLKEFSFVTSHPRDTSLELFSAMRDCGKLKKYLHLPVQSGSDKILNLMNRGYDRKFYLDLADKYRKIVKDGVLTTDIIVGFPTETEEDFLSTRDLVERVEFDAGFIFKYSTRPGTEAAKMPDDVPIKEKERRHQIILELQKKISKNKKC